MSLNLPGVTRGTGRGGLDVYRIDTDACTGEMYDLGAHVTSWRPRGHDEVLWVSDESPYALGDNIRGGIPLCAPWFGVGRPGLNPPQAHGFVRDLTWTLVSAHAGGAGVTLDWELAPSAWHGSPGADLVPPDLSFAYSITFGERLVSRLSFIAGTRPVTIDAALHTYLAVTDVRAATVEGLDGARYFDNVSKRTGLRQVGELTFCGPTDAVFDSTASVTLVDAHRRVRIDKDGSASTVVWNPWRQGAAAMDHFGDDEWAHMVCIEPANAFASAVLVPAGGRASIVQTLSVS